LGIVRFSREQIKEYLMTTLAITPASGSITAARTVCRVDVTEAPLNDDTAYDGTEGGSPGTPAQYPASPEIRYYIAFLESATEYGRSYVFAPNGGKHTFNNYIFPHAGSWTVNLNKVSDDSTEATLAVTVA
jgi:hypothetical protein